MDDQELEKLIDRILAEHPDKSKEYRNLFRKTFGNLMGQVMRANPNLNPELTADILKKKLFEI